MKGYYTAVERSAWGDTRAYDNFVITGGSQKLAHSFADMVDQGNTVNSKNEKGQPVINLNPDDVTKEDQERILTAAKENQIEIIVLRPQFAGREAPVCFSFVKILKVK